MELPVTRQVLLAGRPSRQVAQDTPDYEKSSIAKAHRKLPKSARDQGHEYRASVTLPPLWPPAPSPRAAHRCAPPPPNPNPRNLTLTRILTLTRTRTRTLPSHLALALALTPET